MSTQELRKEAHDLDVTVWVGKGGASSVVDELADQLNREKLVKAKLLRAARSGTTTREVAEALAESVDAELIDVRGHTAVYH